MARDRKLPDWAVVGAKIIHSGGYSDLATVETITRVSKTSVWSASGDYAEGSPNRHETRWVGYNFRDDSILEKWGGSAYSFTFAYPLDSDSGRNMLHKSARTRANREIRELMNAWQKSSTDENSMKLRQALAKWEVKYAAKTPSPARQETERQKLLHPEQD